jgi:hypothetical protein
VQRELRCGSRRLERNRKQIVALLEQERDDSLGQSKSPGHDARAFQILGSLGIESLQYEELALMGRNPAHGEDRIETGQFRKLLRAAEECLQLPLKCKLNLVFVYIE